MLQPGRVIGRLLLHAYEREHRSDTDREPEQLTGDRVSVSLRICDAAWA